MVEGMKLRAKSSCRLDKVTAGAIYEVKQVVEGRYAKHFSILNDAGFVTMPISASFESVSE
ncbi:MULTISPECIES: hypothetical protein [unclassified Psychrobacillus]|uniref:hypothetical protein n=1 Tax=unclassified Psychrobacillus TaxID=2636677 RepID=UPI0030F77544